MLVAMKSFAENQVSLMEKFDNLKDEMKTAVNQIFDDNNTMKQELFILRQSQTVNRTTVQSAPRVHDNVSITDPPSLPKPLTAKRDDKETNTIKMSDLHQSFCIGLFKLSWTLPSVVLFPLVVSLIFSNNFWHAF